MLLLDDDTVRTCYRLYRQDGIGGLAGFSYAGSVCHLSAARQEKLKVWVGETLPRTTRQVGAWIEHASASSIRAGSGLIVLLQRPGMEHHRPQAVSGKLNEAKQKAFIEAYDALRPGWPTTRRCIRPMQPGQWAVGRRRSPRKSQGGSQ